MSCPICGGDLIGDGYSSVIHCENANERVYEFHESDAPMVLCDEKYISPYHFSPSNTSMAVIDVTYVSQLIGTIKKRFGYWSFYPASNEYALSLNTLTAIHEFMKELLLTGK